jgi:hypothetical protein
VPPTFQEGDGQGSLADFVVDRGEKRRHMDVAQRAAAAVNLLPQYEAEAEERQREALKRGNVTKHRDSSIEEFFPQSSENQERAPQARDLAAKALAVNPRYVSDAKRIKEQAPDDAVAMATERWVSMRR